MAHLTVGGVFEAEIDRISNSGNAVIEGDSHNAYALLKSGSWEEGDTVVVKITTKDKDSGHIYTAVPKSREAGAKAPPLHHDGNSVGQTRNMSSAFDSINDREFNPKTHGAPEVESTTSGQNQKQKSSSEPEKSLREIARSLDQTVFTEKGNDR